MSLSFLNIHNARKYVSPRSSPLTPEEQETRWISYFVDNTTTSGNTLRAAREALNFGEALVFSDAGLTRHFTTGTPTR